MPIHNRVLELDASGTHVGGTISTPPGRFAGVYYKFTPDHGTADISITNLGREIFSKTNASNSDGVQELAPDLEKIVDGPVVVQVNEVQAADHVVFRFFIDR